MFSVMGEYHQTPSDALGHLVARNLMLELYIEERSRHEDGPEYRDDKDSPPRLAHRFRALMRFLSVSQANEGTGLPSLRVTPYNSAIGV